MKASIVILDDDSNPLCTLVCAQDGYPEGLGWDISQFILENDKFSTEYLAVEIIKKFPFHKMISTYVPSDFDYNYKIMWTRYTGLVMFVYDNDEDVKAYVPVLEYLKDKPLPE